MYRKYKYFVIHSNIIPIKGYSRSILMDIQRNKTFFIPNNLYSLMDKGIFNIFELKEKLSKDSFTVLNNWISFFHRNHYGIYTNNPSFFPRINTKFIYPSYISNSVLIISKNNIFSIKKTKIFKQLEKLGCKALQIILNFETKQKHISLIEEINNYDFDSIEIIIPKSNKSLYIYYLENIIFFGKIKRVIFYEFPNKKEPIIKNNSILNFSTKEFVISNCGNINLQDFTNNILFYTESFNFNNCLHKKIFIGENGEVKNCPNIKHIMGYIQESSLSAIIEDKRFLFFYKITKDKIKVCKDCEFRHMCMDCRAYIKNPNDIYSQPAKCPYNPYIAKWQGQESYITVEQWQKQNPNWEQQAKEQRQTTY